jgi:hypothetical protein
MIVTPLNNWLEPSSSTTTVPEAWERQLHPRYVAVARPLKMATAAGLLSQQDENRFSEMFSIWSKMENILAEEESEAVVELPQEPQFAPLKVLKMQVEVRSANPAEFRMIVDEEIDDNQIEEW